MIKPPDERLVVPPGIGKEQIILFSHGNPPHLRRPWFKKGLLIFRLAQFHRKVKNSYLLLVVNPRGH
jgi:hypothetical protein